MREEEGFSSDAKKLEARRTGVRGETYAYWYLRRNGYVFVARNYTPRGIKGELDLVGYDGDTLAFVEVRTRTVREESLALPELSVTREKQRVVIRTAQRFLAERRAPESPYRFDVVANRQQTGAAANGAVAQGRVQPANVTVVSWNTVTMTPDAVQSGSY